MSMRTRLLRQSNDLCLWDRIAMFHGWARRHQQGIDVVQELYEQPQELHGRPKERHEKPQKLHGRPQELHEQPRELHEQPGIAGLPALDWKTGHGQLTQRIHGGRPEFSQGGHAGRSAFPHGDWPGDPGRNVRPKDLHMVGQVDAPGHPKWSSPHKNKGSARLKEPHGDRAGIPGHLGGDLASNREKPGGEVFDVRTGQSGRYFHLGNRENPHGDRPSNFGNVYGFQSGDLDQRGRVGIDGSFNKSFHVAGSHYAGDHAHLPDMAGINTVGKIAAHSSTTQLGTSWAPTRSEAAGAAGNNSPSWRNPRGHRPKGIVDFRIYVQGASMIEPWWVERVHLASPRACKSHCGEGLSGRIINVAHVEKAEPSSCGGWCVARYDASSQGTGHHRPRGSPQA